MPSPRPTSELMPGNEAEAAELLDAYLARSVAAPKNRLGISASDGTRTRDLRRDRPAL